MGRKTERDREGGRDGGCPGPDQSFRTPEVGPAGFPNQSFKEALPKWDFCSIHQQPWVVS